MRQERLSEVEREAAGSQPVKAGFFVAADRARRRRAGCAPVTEEKWEAEHSRQLSFHGARPLAIGASSVSGPWQRGQVSIAERRLPIANCSAGKMGAGGCVGEL